MGELRKVQILRNGEWIDSEFKEIKDGDVFRLFEPDGDPVTFHMKIKRSSRLLEMLSSMCIKFGLCK
jgi:hypothetical protein